MYELSVFSQSQSNIRFNECLPFKSFSILATESMSLKRFCFVLRIKETKTPLHIAKRELSTRIFSLWRMNISVVVFASLKLHFQNKNFHLNILFNKFMLEIFWNWIYFLKGSVIYFLISFLNRVLLVFILYIMKNNCWSLFKIPRNMSPRPIWNMIYQANDILKEIKLKWQGLKIYCELLKN